MAKILVVEDEEKIARFIELELQHEGYETGKAADGRTGLEMAESDTYDLMLLDIMLPQLNGLEVLRRLRKSSSMPVIMLTARDAVMDKVSGLDMGADDYITKPFAIEELLARIRNALRHEVVTGLEIKRFGPLGYDADSRAFWINDEPLVLRRTEALVLAALMARPGVLVPRESLEARVYGYDRLVSSNSLESQISRLRRNIGEKTQAIRIHSVRGVGYSLVEE